MVIKASQSCRAPKTVSNDRSSGQNSTVFSHSPTEGREVVTTVTTGLCMPIILCTQLTYPNVAVERKQKTAQVLRKNQVTVCEFVCLSSGNCGCSSGF